MLRFFVVSRVDPQVTSVVQIYHWRDLQLFYTVLQVPCFEIFTRKNGVLQPLARGAERGRPESRKALRGGIAESFLEPLCRSWGHFVGIYRQKIDKVSEKLTLSYPHEGPCVGTAASCLANTGVPHP